MFESTHLGNTNTSGLFLDSSSINNTNPGSERGSESFRKISRLYKKHSELLKNEYRKCVRDICRRLCDNQLESGQVDTSDLKQELHHQVRKLQRKYLKERNKIKNRILGPDNKLDDTIHPDSNLNLYLEEYISSEASKHIQRDNTSLNVSKTLNQSSRLKQDKSLNYTCHLETLNDSIKKQEVGLLREKYQALLQMSLLEYYDADVLRKIEREKIYEMNSGVLIQDFKRHCLRKLQRNYLIERENILKEIDENHTPNYSLRSTASNLNIYFDSEILPFFSISICLLKGQLAMREVYEGHILTFFKESAKSHLSKRRVIKGLEKLQDNYIRLRESFKTSIDKTHSPNTTLAENETYVKILSDNFGYLMNK